MSKTNTKTKTKTKTKTNVIFLHVPKTGGTTLKRAFAKQYEREDIAPVPDDYREQSDKYYPIRNNTASVLYQKTADVAYLKQFNLIMGHYDWNLVRRLGDGYQVAVMLRHPVRQLVSLYEYYRSTPDADRSGSHALCNKVTFREWLDTEHCHLRLNQACQALSGVRHGVFVDHVSALNNLDRCVVGMVEDMSGALATFNEAFAHELHPDVRRVNASPVRAEDVTLDPETYQLAAHNQRYDMMLYDKVMRSTAMSNEGED